MTSLLEHPLVLNYFACLGHKVEDCKERPDCQERIAYRILRAMQEPIRKGDKIIQTPTCVDPDMNEAICPDDIGGFHAFHLRLPDKFQAAGKPCCEYHEGKWRNDTTAGKVVPWCGEHKTQTPPEPTINPLHQGPHTRPEAEPVEKLIEELVEFFGAEGARHTNEAIRKMFRELVSLARGERA